MGGYPLSDLAGVIFDLDGVLADTEHLWEESWQRYLAASGHGWGDGLTSQLQGMNSYEWSRHLAEYIGRPQDAEPIRQACITHVVSEIDAGRGPLLPGARRLVEDVAKRVPIGLASSAAREVIDRILTSNDIAGLFAATVSSEEVALGKPAPDVYAEAVHRVGFTGPGLAVEDSSNGIRSAHAAGLYVIAIPNPQYPPAADALALADFVAAGHDQAHDHALAQLK
ncbi:MAG TPA: HAD family phosphatase [Mycobacteriales bacterium]|nr:HAD family phosphatase [Mycobacteriales bacterium]